jgi:hypothetical protein
MRNADEKGIAHYPGWSKEVLTYLYEKQKITASGHETTDTDPGIATSRGDYSLETYILSQDRYQIELLTNLDKVPEYGAIIVVTFPKPKHGSGFSPEFLQSFYSNSSGQQYYEKVMKYDHSTGSVQASEACDPGKGQRTIFEHGSQI